jgi:DNA recombination protein RmuC
VGPTAVIAVALLAVVAGVGLALFLTRQQRTGSEELVARLRRELEQQRDASTAAAVDTLVTVAREQLASQSQAGERALDTRNQMMDQRLDAMHGELDRVRKLVTELEQARERSFGALSNELTRASRATSELATVAGGLREALANSRARGQWGERMADDVLRTAGFVEGVNYVKQTTTAQGRPDVTFLLPGERVLHMDVKFPLDNYLRVLEAERPDDAEAAEKAFLRDVRNRVKELADRRYHDDGDALDQVLLFIPNEQIHAIVHERDPGLLDEALRQRVVLCSPVSLFGVLAVVRQAVDAFAVESRSRDILDALAGFTDQWERFVGQMDKVGTRLDSVRKEYDALTGTRRRQLDRRIEAIQELREGRDAPAAPLRAVAGDAAGGSSA